MTWSAYIDESMRRPAEGPAMYVIAAAVVEDEHEDRVRSLVRTLLGQGRGQFHWRQAERPERKKAVEIVAGLPALHIVTVGTPLLKAKQERGRRLCLRRLLYELDDAGVALATLEARTESLNIRDQRAIVGWRAQRMLSSRIRVHFAYRSAVGLDSGPRRRCGRHRACWRDTGVPRAVATPAHRVRRASVLRSQKAQSRGPGLPRGSSAPLPDLSADGWLCLQDSCTYATPASPVLSYAVSFSPRAVRPGPEVSPRPASYGGR
jgi:hypothetical protein